MKNKKIVLVTLIEAMILSCSSGNYKGEGSRVREGNPEDFLVPVIPGKPGNTSIPPNTTSTINPDIPGGPYTPSNPNIPETPINPVTPGSPSSPLNPSVPVAPLNPGTPITPVIPAPVYKLKEDPERFRIAFTDNPDIFTVHIPEANLPSDREVKDSITTSETDEGHIGIKIESEVDPVTGAHRPSYEKTLFLYSDIQMKGKKSIGVYAKGVNTILEWGNTIEVQEDSIGIFAEANDQYSESLDFVNAHTVVDTGGNIEIKGKNSIGIYYKSGKEQRMGAIVHQGEINSSASNVVGIFTDSGSDKKIFMNEGTINLSGDKSVGMYGTGGGGYELKNLGDIIIGDSSDRNNPSIGMYSANGSTRLLNNSGRRNMGIRVGKNSIGIMKSKGTASADKPEILNDWFSTIELAGDNSIGMVLGENVYGQNQGTIKTVAVDGKNPEGVIGVLLGKNAKFENDYRGVIEISSPGGVAILNSGGTIKNYGVIKVSDGAVEERELRISDPDILSKNIEVAPLEEESTKIYVDTLGKTNPIEGIAFLGAKKLNLVMGAEAAFHTNETEIKVEEKILDRYNKSFKGGSIKEIKIASDALLWNTESETDGDEIKSVLLKKKSYTEFAENEKEKLIAQGLDQRYGVNAYDSEEKQIFNSLNTLSNNQKELLSKTYKEVSGSQYINVQQRLKETGEILDDEIENLEDYLHIEGLEDSNKISTFVTEGKYSSKTDEIPDHRTKGFGVAYLHNRNIDKWGWYVAAGINNFKLKDNGKSEEEILMLKAGGYKTIDLANEVKWTVSGEGYVARSEMERKYDVLGNIYMGQSSYNSYGVAVKNKIHKNFFLTEGITVKPYAGLKTEYGKFEDIREKNGVLRLEVAGNNYYSIRPELGVEFSYIKPVFTDSKIRAALGLAYDYELGKIENIENKGRFKETTADWFTLKGERNQSKGNLKADLKIGFITGKYDFSLKGEYNTRGEDARIGVDFGASF